MKDWLITWMAAIVVAAAFLIIGAVEDAPAQDQMAADEIKAAKVQAKVDHEKAMKEFRANQIYMDHLLGLQK